MVDQLGDFQRLNSTQPLIWQLFKISGSSKGMIESEKCQTDINDHNSIGFI